MAEKKAPTTNQTKQVAEQIWLEYFNQVLFEKGLISETERNRMKNKISSRKPSIN